MLLTLVASVQAAAPSCSSCREYGMSGSGTLYACASNSGCGNSMDKDGGYCCWQGWRPNSGCSACAAPTAAPPPPTPVPATYTKESDFDCYYTYSGDRYNTLAAAEAACNEKGPTKCFGVSDWNCDDGPYALCQWSPNPFARIVHSPGNCYYKNPASKIYVPTFKRELKTYCPKQASVSYNTLKEAEAACIDLVGCYAVIDSYCSGDERDSYGLCMSSETTSNSRDCIYKNPDPKPATPPYTKASDFKCVDIGSYYDTLAAAEAACNQQGASKCFGVSDPLGSGVRYFLCTSDKTQYSENACYYKNPASKIYEPTFTKEVKTTCSTFSTQYATLAEAEAACSELAGCYGVLDEKCASDSYLLCKASAVTSSSYSTPCVYTNPAPKPATPAPAPPASPAAPKDASGLGGGVIAGVIIGGLILIGAVAGAVVYVLVIRPKASRTAQMEEPKQSSLNELAYHPMEEGTVNKTNSA